VFTHRAGLLDADGNLPRLRQALIADSFAAMFGSLIGTSTTTSYIESAAGVSAGGRTGLTAVFVALFFLLALFFSPLVGMVPAYASAAALLYVACVMTQGLAEIAWDDITEYAPAVVAAVTMPLTYSIATGSGSSPVQLPRSLPASSLRRSPRCWRLLRCLRSSLRSRADLQRSRSS
jgi:AGZA family xanthine/uracil permease-like MFS transporter